MIKFHRFTLDNGLRVLVHEDQSSPMVAVNICYHVGAKDESPERTGFAHLFEHLMFSGTIAAPNFDTPLQQAGGENNAFTNNDITNFYNLIPAANIETALWLESDRMVNLHVTAETLDVQRKVVIEEFKETCLNEPYGDVWHHIGELAYQVHPYQWPTIGRTPEHVHKASLEEVQDFYQRFYSPNNAVLVISGNTSIEQAQYLVKKWFDHIPPQAINKRTLPQEPVQKEFKNKVIHENAPTNAIYLAFHIPERIHPSFYAADLISDLLSNGPSSRLYRKLLKEQQLFSAIDCYISGTIDPGLLIIEGKPSDEVSIKQAREALWGEITALKETLITPKELDKVINKVESTVIFSEVSILNKAINLAFFEILGDADLINRESKLYQEVTPTDIYVMANKTLVQENCSEVVYIANKEEEE